jgi:Flp pilus assembly protein TadG
MRVSARDERGAVAVVVAILLVVLFGFAAFALDTGNAWQSRRHLITATDAAALAAAREFALGQNGCAGTDDAMVGANFAGSSVEACTASTTSGPGYVTVRASHDVEWNFARIFGLTSGTIHSSTTAAWSNPLGLKGLRPLGLCANVPELADWLASGPTGPSGTVRIMYTKDHPDDCGGTAPGNWGVQDFNGGNNSNNETRDWLENGYPDLVKKGSWIPGNTGSFSNSLSSELSMLVSSGQSFTLPVFSSVTGNGSNASFHIVEFVGVKLVGYQATGREDERYIDLQFQLIVAQGECCDRGGDNTGVSIVHICSVDHAAIDPNEC